MTTGTGEPRRVERTKSSLPLLRREGGGRFSAAEIATGLSVSPPVYEPRPLQAR